MALTMSDVDQNAVQAFQDVDIAPTWTKAFPLIGKGTLLFNIARDASFCIIVRDITANNDSWIGLTVAQQRVSFLEKRYDKDPKVRILCEATSHEFFGDNVGTELCMICTYWLSYDSDRMVVKYGKGYRMERTTILKYDYGKEDDVDTVREIFFDPTVRRYVQLYDNISKSPKSVTEVEKEVDFDPIPFVSDYSYIVKGSSTANLFDLDSGRYTYSASLPPECLTLYTNVTGDDVDLDYVDADPSHQYDFKLTDAIRYSIETKGCLLYEKLLTKDEFGDPAETYLRITVGKDHGSSPGIPYVLEIWPKNHGSPIHNHGNAYAVIRVLHGGLNIHYFNKQSERVNPDDAQNGEAVDRQQLGEFNVKKGDVTWISPNWYQTHQLWNNTADYCATIQCYQYGSNDYANWPYFDYVSNTDLIEEFMPDSDYSFTEMFDKVMKEYADAKAN